LSSEDNKKRISWPNQNWRTMTSLLEVGVKRWGKKVIQDFVEKRECGIYFKAKNSLRAGGMLAGVIGPSLSKG